MTVSLAKGLRSLLLIYLLFQNASQVYVNNLQLLKKKKDIAPWQFSHISKHVRLKILMTQSAT